MNPPYYTPKAGEPWWPYITVRFKAYSEPGFYWMPRSPYPN